MGVDLEALRVEFGDGLVGGCCRWPLSDVEEAGLIDVTRGSCEAYGSWADGFE